GGRAAGYFTGATGVTIYRGDAWPDVHEPLAIVGDVGSNLVHRKRLTPNGVQMIGRRIDDHSEFVASTDNWFRPAQFACGPDGTLSVVDVYREVIEHPKSLPPDIKQHLDLTSGRDRGRIYRIVPENYVHRQTANLSQLDSESLAKQLLHPNAWHRETAARLLYERQDASVAETLRRQADNADSAQGRLHSLYALSGLGLLKADDLIARFSDSHPQVVRHAIRLAESFPNDGRLPLALKPLIRHPSIDVRYQLAFSIGEFKSDQSEQWLAELVMQDPSDRWIQTAASSSVGKEPERLLVALLESEPVEQLAPFLEQLSVQVDRKNDIPARKQSLAALAKCDDHPRLLPIIGRLQRGGLEDQIGRDLDDRISLMKSRLIPIALAIVIDDDRSDEERIRAIGWLDDVRSESLFTTLQKVLSSTDSAELQIAIIRAIARFDSPQTDAILLKNWTQWSPRIRSVAGDVMFANSRRSNAVLDAIDDHVIDPADIPMTRWNALANSRDESLRERAKKHLTRSNQTSRDAVIRQYQSVAEISGDRIRGREVFKKQCAGCHKIGDVGHELGPSLVAASTRGRESILTNVLDPNREVNPQYVNYVVLTIDGRATSGMIASENANSITLVRSEGVTETVLRSDIELIRNTNQSVMPEGLEKAIPPQAMADLIRYLISSNLESAP
ncbi:MAG: HEAT repeat domain-containing protein, partial [Planctomycetales bacterium]|nr:HEAT repeat domain-containing protein [Planctomycetales bacterium]